MHFNFISLVLGLFAVVYAAPLDVNHNKDIGSQLSSRNQPFDPNGKVIVAFNQNSGNNSQGLAPPHHPPVPQQVETRVADYFRETFSDMQCDIRYEAGTVYMLENELAIFQIRWRWDNSMYWQGVEIGGATKKELQPQQADLPDKIGVTHGPTMLMVCSPKQKGRSQRPNDSEHKGSEAAQRITQLHVIFRL
ncbi:hypothetical protein EV368DRAFT_61704 [Lentinula lateritia]|nr:hypothetical protein EV368DRAFT_61704 [Lentinula lateritia]